MGPEPAEDVLGTGKRPKSKTHKERMTALQRNELKAKAAANALAGATQREIAAMLDTSASTVNRLLAELDAEWRESALGDIERRKVRMARRYDVQINAVWSKAIAGDLRAMDVLLRIEEAERKLLGLDAPIRTEAQVTANVTANVGLEIDYDNLSDEAAEKLGAALRALEMAQEEALAEQAERALVPLPRVAS